MKEDIDNMKLKQEAETRLEKTEENVNSNEIERQTHIMMVISASCCEIELSSRHIRVEILLQRILILGKATVELL